MCWSCEKGRNVKQVKMNNDDMSTDAYMRLPAYMYYVWFYKKKFSKRIHVWEE